MGNEDKDKVTGNECLVNEFITMFLTQLRFHYIESKLEFPYSQIHAANRIRKLKMYVLLWSNLEAWP